MTGSLQPRRVALWVQRTDGTFWSGVITGNDKPGKLAMPPYSVYFPWLADKLLRSTRLLIIGYGIGDYHLNVSLLTALRFHAKRDIRCVIVDCFDPDSGNLPDSLGLYAYATGKDSALTPEEQKAIQFKDGTARSEGAMLVHTGFPLTDTQLDEVGGFLSS